MTSTKNDQFFDPPLPHYPQKWTIDLLFKNNRIRKHMTNFKTPPPTFRVDIVNIWSHSNLKCKMKRLQIPQKLVDEKFYVHEQILRTRNCCLKFIKNLLSEKHKENITSRKMQKKPCKPNNCDLNPNWINVFHIYFLISANEVIFYDGL